MQSGGNPRTTTPTDYEPKELAAVSRIEDYSGDPYQLHDEQEIFGEEDGQEDGVPKASLQQGAADPRGLRTCVCANTISPCVAHAGLEG